MHLVAVGIQFPVFHAAGNEQADPPVGIGVGQVTEPPSARELPFEAAVGGDSAVHVVDARHLVIIQVRIGLDGGQAGEFFLGMAVAEVQADVAVSEREQHGGDDLPVQEARARTGIPEAGDVGHAVVGLHSDGNPVRQRGGIEVEGEAAVMARIILRHGAAVDVRDGEPRVHDIGPLAVLLPVQVVVERSLHEQLVAEGIVAEGGEGEAEVGVSFLGPVEIACIPEDAELGPASLGRLVEAHSRRVVGLGEGLFQLLQRLLLEIGRSAVLGTEGGAAEEDGQKGEDLFHRSSSFS